MSGFTGGGQNDLTALYLSNPQLAQTLRRQQLANSIMVYTIDPNATVLSGICATGNTTNLRLTRGAGA